MAKKHTGIDTFGAFIAGAAAAAAAGGYFLYGPKGKQNRKKVEAWTLKVKGEILHNIEKAKELNKETYEVLVEQGMAKYAKTKDIGMAKKEELMKELKKHWKYIEKEAQKKATTGKKKATKKVQKARKKIAKKVAPKK